jgi:hypothetical protein
LNDKETDMTRQTKTMIIVVAVLVVLVSIGSFLGRGSGSEAGPVPWGVTPWGYSSTGTLPDTTVPGSNNEWTAITHVDLEIDALPESTVPPTPVPVIRIETVVNNVTISQLYPLTNLNDSLYYLHESQLVIDEPGSPIKLTSSGLPSNITSHVYLSGFRWPAENNRFITLGPVSCCHPWEKSPISPDTK